MTTYKLLALIGGTSTAIGGGVLLTQSSMFKNKSIPKVQVTIRDRLQRSGYSFNLDNSKWEAIRDEHNKLQNTNSLRFSSSNIDVNVLKTKCEAYWEENENDSKYEVAKRWCVEPRSVSEFLTSSNLNALKTADDTEQNGDKSKWVKLEEEYLKNTREKIQGWNFSKAKDENTWKELQTKCKALLNLKPWNDDYEMAMNKTKIWCTEEGIPK